MNQLIDNFNRNINYLRISITDRCDFRCTYCMNEKMEFLPRSEVLSLEEVEEVARAFVSLGAKKIRITGGEPLVRNGAPELLSKISEIEGLDELVMTTNGSSLEKYAKQIYESGVSRLNISLDSLDPEKFKQITRIGELDKVLAGIRCANAFPFKRIKLNSVIMKGLNDDEVLDLLGFAVENALDISFIEEMPLGEIDHHDREYTFIASEELLNLISKSYKLSPIDVGSERVTSGPARTYTLDSLTGERLSTKVGFISPHSNNFCSSCNRVRVSAEGRLLLCLGNEHSLDLKSIIRNEDYSIEKLKHAIVESMGIKPEKHEFDLSSDVSIVRFMNMTGG